MFTFLSVLYVLICLFLILVVLLQSGKGGGMGAAFGGGGGAGQQVFGGAGAGNILTKMTAVSAALFMVLSATLAYMSSPGEDALERATEDLNANLPAAGAAAEGGAVESDETPQEEDPEESLDTAGAEGAREAFGDLVDGDDDAEEAADVDEANDTDTDESTDVESPTPAAAVAPTRPAPRAPTSPMTPSARTEAEVERSAEHGPLEAPGPGRAAAMAAEAIEDQATGDDPSVQ